MIIRHELPTYQWMTFLFEERFLYHNNSRGGIQVFFEIDKVLVVKFGQSN